MFECVNSLICRTALLEVKMLHLQATCRVPMTALFRRKQMCWNLNKLALELVPSTVLDIPKDLFANLRGCYRRVNVMTPVSATAWLTVRLSEIELNMFRCFMCWVMSVVGIVVTGVTFGHWCNGVVTGVTDVNSVCFENSADQWKMSRTFTI